VTSGEGKSSLKRREATQLSWVASPYTFVQILL